MSRFDPGRQESLKRMWQDQRRSATSIDESFKHYKLASCSISMGMAPPVLPSNSNPRKRSFFDDDLVAAVVPPVTVVLEGRSICHRISLHKHTSYQSLAGALRQMFVDDDDQDHHNISINLDLSNAVPGHVIAYEDMENDLLLVGDLNWKDFVRVAKRIRILPAKVKSRNLQIFSNNNKQ